MSVLVTLFGLSLVAIFLVVLSRTNFSDEPDYSEYEKQLEMYEDEFNEKDSDEEQVQVSEV